MKLHRQLTKAKVFLESHQWIKGRLVARYNNGNIRGCCAAGAVHTAVGANPDRGLVLDFLNECLSLEGLTLTRWNDAPGRTKKEVVQLFAEAAKAAKRYDL